MSRPTAISSTDVSPKIRSVSVFDADALSKAVRSSNFEHVQLESGSFQAELKRLDLGALPVDSGFYSRKVIARDDLPPGHIILGCLLDSREEGYINGYRFRRNDIVIFPEGSELDHMQPAATNWCAIQLPGSILEEIGGTEMWLDRI